MRRINALGALMCGLGCYAVVGSAHAATLFSFSGQVGLADGVAPAGVKVKLQVDLDRNGKFDSFETLSAKVASDGSYTFAYDLSPTDVDLKFLKFVSGVVADYEARGFESLLDDGPLPVVLSFEREGYGTVVKRLNTMFQSPNLDVTLAPLADVQCAGNSCLSVDGGVRLDDFPAGTKIQRPQGRKCSRRIWSRPLPAYLSRTRSRHPPGKARSVKRRGPAASQPRVIAWTWVKSRSNSKSHDCAR